MVSLTATGYESVIESKNLQRLNYNYTNQSRIDAAVNSEGESINPKKVNWNSSRLGVSRDLLIGGPSNNILQSGAGDDFLFGGRGDDKLWGGPGNDTAVYFGSCSDYDIRQNSDGSWTVRNVRGARDAGTDNLRNIEFIQFDGDTVDTKKIFELKKDGLKCQKDIAFVIDTTGSMVTSIDAIKAQASLLIDAVFANDNDARIGVVSFRDTTNGEPSQVILPFTDQDNFADRKSAAIAAINNLTIGDGGDIPETDFDGLRLALNGSMGEWRFGAGKRQIVLFTDAPVKDGALAAEVTALARNIGGTLGSISSRAVAGGSIDTFNISFSGRGSSVSGQSGLFGFDDPDADPNTDPAPPFEPSNEPIDPDPTTAEVQIFTIFTGPSNSDTTALSEIASANGGAFLTASDSDDLVMNLIDIVNPLLPIEGTPKDDLLVGTDRRDFIYGLAGKDTIYGRAGKDTIYGGDGDDTLYGDAGNDTLYGDAGNDTLFGGDDNDALYGDAGSDTLYGDAGNDTLYGDAGNDTLFGGAGNDTLFGGAGVDRLFGGAGNDIFVYNSPAEGIDKINDFVVGEDLLSVSSDGFGGANMFGSEGVLDPSRFTLGSVATNTSQRFIYNDRSGALFFDADGMGGAAQVRLAQFVGNPALTNASFFVLGNPILT